MRVSVETLHSLFLVRCIYDDIIPCINTVYKAPLCVSFPGVFLSSRVTGACPVTMDLIMRVNVRTTTTTHQVPFTEPNISENTYRYTFHQTYRFGR